MPAQERECPDEPRTVAALPLGLVDREIGAVAGPGAAPCVRYSLTKRGETVRPILTAIARWGNSHLAANGADEQMTR